MTNKPMLSVERELLSSICDDFEAGQHSKACEGASNLRAILDDKYRAPPINIHCHANNVQIIRNEDGSYTLRNKVDQAQNPKITVRVYSFSADETAPADKTQVAPPGATHFEKSDKCPSTGWIQYYRHDGCCRWSYWPEGLGHWSSLACKPDGDVKSLYAEQPAPVAVVMPERQIVPDNLMAGLTRKWCEGWNDALEEVARLNGVKP